FQDPHNLVEAHGHEDYDHSSWFSAFVPQEEDGCYLDSTGTGDGDGLGGVSAAGAHDSPDVVCWWHMEDGRVLGVHAGMLVEYDAELLSPLGVVRDRNQLRDREVVVLEGGKAAMLVPSIFTSTFCSSSFTSSSSGHGDDLGPTSDIEVIHPNEDGGYAKVFQRNKAVRNREKEREDLAKEWLRQSRQT
ncbi:unnamed protein product, partial [Choristocarpus tenellus]